jgi:hypothetical protein
MASLSVRSDTSTLLMRNAITLRSVSALFTGLGLGLAGVRRHTRELCAAQTMAEDCSRMIEASRVANARPVGSGGAPDGRHIGVRTTRSIPLALSPSPYLEESQEGRTFPRHGQGRGAASSSQKLIGMHAPRRCACSVHHQRPPGCAGRTR